MMTNAVRFLAIGALACSLASCDWGSSTEPEPAPGPTLQELRIAAAAVPADGRALTVVRAVIPAGARVVPRQITFSTTAGAFSPGATDSMRTTVNVDEDGEAVALLRAPLAPSLAVVRAQAGNTTLQDTVRFTPAPADLASLTLSTDSAAADSVSLVVVRAVLPRTSTVSPRAVTFATSAGRFANEQDTVTVPADSSGAATTVLRAPVAPGLALVRARAGNTTLQDSVRFYRAPADLLSFTVSADSLQADSASTLVVRATVRGGTARTPRSVTFQTTSGTFDGDQTPESVTVSVDSAGTATALLRAPIRTGDALVRALAGNALLERTVRFVRAWPESIVLNADSFRVGGSSGKTLVIRATLRRSVGKVTPGATVMFTAVDSAGTAIGWFAGETVSDTSGVAQATFTPGTTPYRGPVRIMAHTRGATGTMLGAEMRIEVIDP